MTRSCSRHCLPGKVIKWGYKGFKAIKGKPTYFPNVGGGITYQTLIKPNQDVTRFPLPGVKHPSFWFPSIDKSVLPLPSVQHLNTLVGM